MAGSILVFLAILGGAVFIAAAMKRRVAEMIPLSAAFLIVHTYLCGLLGLLRFSVIVTVFAMILLGAVGLYLGYRKKSAWNPKWDLLLVLFGLSLAWLVYVSMGRIPLAQEDFTQWALAPKAMFYLGSLTPADGTLAVSPALCVFQYVFQVCNSLFAPGEGFSEWLLYVAGGTACLALLLPFVISGHPRKSVRAGYTLLIFSAVLCVPLLSFDLFSALNPDGFLAILAALCFLTAAQKKSIPQAVIMGLYLFTLTLAKDAGLYFALGAFAVYLATLLRSEEYKQSASPRRRAALIAVPALCILAVRLSWPHLSFSLHGAELTSGISQLFWQNFTAKLIPYRLGLSLGGKTVFTLATAYASFLGLTVLLAGFTALLIRSVKARASLRDTRTALLYASAAALLYMAGLWLMYLFAAPEADAAKLLNFQRLASVGYVFWTLLIAAAALRVQAETPGWSWRRHGLVILTCLCVVLLGSGALDTLSGRGFTADTERHQTYYAVADDARVLIPEDAAVYIVSQNDDGASYHAIRYALYPRRTNPDNTFWLASPEQKPNGWTYPVAAEEWKTGLADYDFVLVYRADNYLKTEIAQAVTSDAVIEPNTIYLFDRETGLLDAAGE